MTVPNAWPGNLGSTADWGNETTAQAHAGTVAYPRGRALGGSGAINVWRMYAGHQAVYDGWATAGAPGWRVADPLPFFRRMSGPGPPRRHHCRRATATADRSARDWPCEAASAAAELRHPAVATPASEVMTTDAGGADELREAIRGQDALTADA